MALNPLDLGIAEEETAALIDGDTPLPTATLPPRPADLRSKEGREWKKLKKQLEENGTAYKLSGDDAVTAAPSSGGKPRTKKNVEHFRKVLLSFHAKCALVTGIEEVALDDEEATMLAEATADLLSYYNIKVSGKGGAVLGLVYAVTMIYGSRLLPYILPGIIENISGIFKRQPVPEQSNVVRGPFAS